MAKRLLAMMKGVDILTEEGLDAFVDALRHQLATSDNDGGEFPEAGDAATVDPKQRPARKKGCKP